MSDKSFGSALKSAADASLANGSINAAGHAAIHAAADDPHVVAAAEPIAAFHVGQTLGAIDWGSLIAKIQTLLPLILQLLALFTKTP